jgi:hypothetical protein
VTDYYFGSFSYRNTDTVVHLHRLPVGPDGIGATSAEIFDRTGFVGTWAQMLLVQRR